MSGIVIGSGNVSRRLLFSPPLSCVQQNLLYSHHIWCSVTCAKERQIEQQLRSPPLQPCQSQRRHWPAPIGKGSPEDEQPCAQHSSCCCGGGVVGFFCADAGTVCGGVHVRRQKDQALSRCLIPCEGRCRVGVTLVNDGTCTNG
jgi:hypothetical protein